VSWTDAFRLALESVTRRFGRTVLTVLSVVLASALLVALATIVVTANSRVISQVSKGGPITAIRVAAARAQPGQLQTDEFRLGEPLAIDDAALEQIRSLPGVTHAEPVLDLDVFAIPPLMPRGDRQFFERIVGVDLRQAQELPITLLAGRLPAPGYSNEVAVTMGYLDRLHLDAGNPAAVLGQTVALGSPQVYRGLDGHVRFRGRWIDATVVGVVAQEAAPAMFLLPLEQVEADRAWALEGIGVRFEPLPTSRYSGVVVVASTLSSVHAVRSEITDLGYSTSAPEQLIANLQRYLRVVDIVLSAIGLIALVIAALGITNAMLAAVRERRREIGVLKAVGARDRDVMRTFLIEAGSIGLLGGTIGTLFGIGLAGLVGLVVNTYLRRQGLIGVKLLIPFSVVAAGIIGSTALALVAGTVPALRAAQLPAREAVGGA
jgi:ABC-type antimicrobial peptide transport system permease subunit